MIKWHCEKRKIDELKGWEDNPRIFTEKGLKDLDESINKFGLAEPIVIQPDGDIIGGHARLKVLKDRGETEVDCYIPDKKLTKKQREELAIRLNKNVAGEWDWDKLGEWEPEELREWGFEGLGLTPDLSDEIITEPEYVDELDETDRRYDAIVRKVEKLKTNKKALESKAVILSSKSNDIIVISDDNLDDFLTEIKRNIDSGNESILSNILNSVYKL